MERVQAIATHEDAIGIVDAGDFREDLANSVTAIFGLGLSIVGLAYLLRIAADAGNVRMIVGCAIYGVSLVTLFVASSLYHSVRHERLKDIFRLFDHASIYVVIAGSYTPFALFWLDGVLTWTLCGVMWVLAIIGIVFKIVFRYRYESFSTIMYVIMGWAGVFVAQPILEDSPIDGLLLAVTGGVIFTAGTIFYIFDERRYFHAIWHLFVLGGSVCQYFAVVYYVVPMST
jgi:hemolysin III